MTTAATTTRTTTLAERLSLRGRLPEVHRARRILPLLAVGITAGLIGAAYLGALHILQQWFWPGRNSMTTQSLLLVGTGLVIAAATRWIGPGGNVELLVDNIHVLGGAATDRGDRALVPLSLLGISVGSTLGPEAPLVQTCGSMGSAIARRLGLGQPDVRVLTLVGMAAGFTVLFGTPVGATIFALEVLHRRGLEYYEALVPALVGGLSGYAVFVLGTSLGVRPVWEFTSIGSMHPVDLAAALVAGLAGTLIAAAFAAMVHLLRRAEGACRCGACRSSVVWGWLHSDVGARTR
ncbi:MAG: chloride channel protein [Microthrixaceae bacterium]|nr:chloride channel protein [Microthrixaceae bacterium]